MKNKLQKRKKERKERKQGEIRKKETEIETQRKEVRRNWQPHSIADLSLSDWIS